MIAPSRGTGQPGRMAKGRKLKSSELRDLLAARLKAARLAYMQNGAAFARLMGLAPQRLHQYEKGTSYPDEQFLVRFCDVTGCTMDWLFRGKRSIERSIKSCDGMAARLKAARVAYMEDGAGVASRLEVSPQKLEAYEKGSLSPDEDFLVRFCDLTGCTMDWLFRGRMSSSLPPEMGARIGHFAPALVPGLEKGLAETAAARPAEAGMSVGAALNADT